MVAFVSPENEASQAMQRKLGFVEKEPEQFNYFDNAGDLMFEKDLTQKYTVMKTDANSFAPALWMYRESSGEFCGTKLLIADIKKILSDEKRENYYICKSCMPVGWLCTRAEGNDLLLEYFIVQEKQRHQGIGKQLLSFAIKLAKEKGLTGIYAYVTDKNLPANRMARQGGFEKIKTESLESDSFGPFIRYTCYKTI